MKKASIIALTIVSAVVLIALAGVSLYRYFVDSRIQDGGRMENPDTYRAGKDLVEFEWRKPSPNVQDETDSEIRVIWRTDDGNEIQKLSGNHAEALETLVLRIAEEAYATSNLETE